MSEHEVVKLSVDPRALMEAQAETKAKLFQNVVLFLIRVILAGGFLYTGTQMLPPVYRFMLAFLCFTFWSAIVNHKGEQRK